jgi:DNA invertase Pin-like site-specific DNA recombinase
MNLWYTMGLQLGGLSMSQLKRAAMYVRVSTDKQTVANQIEKLTAVAKLRDWKIVATYRDDGFSGSKSRRDRPWLDAMLKAAQRHSFDVLMVWSLDRLGRSTIDLLKTSNSLKQEGRDLYLDREQIDTGTDHGQAYFTILAALAELERKQIIARVNAGLARARRAGKVLGRRPVEKDPEGAAKAHKARKLLAAGVGINKVAKAVGLSNGTVARLRGVATTS